MDKFSELIAQGVAKFNYTNITGDITDTYDQSPDSQMIRDYNNIYSILTNTHMSRTADGSIIITGSLVKSKREFDNFLHAYTFCNVTLPKTLSQFLCDHGYIGTFSVLNGDDVYALISNITHPEIATKYCQDCGCASIDTAVKVSNESKIPQNIKYISKTANIESVKECFESEDIIKALNEHSDIIGNNWTVVGYSDGHQIVELDSLTFIKRK